MIACAAARLPGAAWHSSPSAGAETAHEMVGYFSPADGRPRSLLFTRGDERVEISGRRRLAVNEASTYLLAGLAGSA